MRTYGFLHLDGGRLAIRRGISRTVVVTRRWAFKVPSLKHRHVVRGWMANRSEWRQRHRHGVVRPVCSVAHLVLVMPAADRVGQEGEEGPWLAIGEDAERGDETKPMNWGEFAGRWLLIDFDRSWDHPRGIVGGLYWWRQEQLARRWMRLVPSSRP